MSLKKVKIQDLELVKANQPLIIDWVESNFKDELLSKQVKGKIAGLLIEVVIASGGSPDVFTLGDDCKRETAYTQEFEGEEI